jgi:hypothetical protein
MNKPKTLKFIKSLKFSLACGENAGVCFYSVNGGKRFNRQEALKAIKDNMKKLRSK